MIDLTTIPLDTLLAEIRRRVNWATNAISASPSTDLSLVELGEIVAECHGIGAEWLPHDCRTRRVAMARMQFCVAARQRIPGATYAEIGAVIRRDHGTVIHAMRRHADQLAGDPDYQRLWVKVEGRIPTSSRHASRRSTRQV